MTWLIKTYSERGRCTSAAENNNHSSSPAPINPQNALCADRFDSHPPYHVHSNLRSNFYN